MRTATPKLWATPSISARILCVSGELSNPVEPQTMLLEKWSPQTEPPAFYQGFPAGGHSQFSGNGVSRDPDLGLCCHAPGWEREGEERSTVCWPAALFICPSAEGLTCVAHSIGLERTLPESWTLKLLSSRDRRQTLPEEHPQAVGTPLKEEMDELPDSPALCSHPHFWRF